MKLETIIAWDHHSAISESLEEMKANRAYIVTHGVVVDEDDLYLYVAQGGCAFVSEPDNLYREDADYTAVLKSTVVIRQAHVDIPAGLASDADIERLRKVMGAS